ncbi:MAG: phosphomethylpyrimidine synthase ThiC [Candidatus Omnitrophica bacterium]|nr:phosphomethylpyrimidine synthase ThiC [Candidatus Omnitrophota bacterium]
MIKVPLKLIKEAAKREDAAVSDIKKGVLSGQIVVPKNRGHSISRPCGIGKGMTTKVNANLGLSPGHSGMDMELRKMKIAVRAGADTVMDLSTGPFLQKLKKKLLSECPVPLGTVPVYELASAAGKDFSSLKEGDFVEIVEKQAEEGVDFFTIHAGLTLEAVRFAKKDPRIINIVSRGGALLASWMDENGRENPFLSQFDRILDICRRHDVTLSLGDSMRPGAIADATDHLQIQELLVLGDLQKRAFTRGVQSMIEGPGHLPLDQIESNVKVQKTLCHGAPFYVLGPLVTDAAPGYDHIVSAIGGAIAAWHGADFLCYVTPAEHLKLPDAEDVRMGVIASKIAAHAADIVKGIPSAAERDREISKARARRDWKTQFRLSLDPGMPEKVRKTAEPEEKDVCTMCAEFCPIRITERSFALKAGRSGKVGAKKPRGQRSARGKKA